MKNLKYIFILFLSIQFSCIDDKSKFGGNEIDAITIEGIEEYKEIEIGTKLEIKPTVITKFSDKSQLSYVWYKYNKEQAVPDTLSHEKNLDVIIGDVLPGVITTLVFKVIDLQTGIFAMHKSSFVTVGKYSGGTLMLCRVDGENDLAMLKKDGKTLYENIYSYANDGTRLGKESKRIILTDSYEANPLGHKSVIVTCDDETGGVYLDPVIFTRQNYMKEKFILGEEMKGDLVITGYIATAEGDYLVANGKVYNRVNGDKAKADWNPELVFLAEPKDYYAASSIGNSVGIMFYDNLHNRFMVNEKGVGYFSFITGKDYDFSSYDPNDIGEGIELVIMGNQSSRTDFMWELMKNTKTGEYILLKSKTGFNSSWQTIFVAEDKKVLSKSEFPHLYEATNFIAGTKLFFANSYPWKNYVLGQPNIFFFLSNNKIYAFNIGTLSEAVLIDGDVENYTITGMDCTEIKDPQGVEDTYVQLTVTVKDRGLAGKSGGIAIYRLDNVGGLSAEKIYAKTGFCDEVLYTVEKLN
mgnify:FL=1